MLKTRLIEKAGTCFHHSGALEPGQDLTLRINRADGSSQEVVVTCRIDTVNEVQYFQSGGILNYVLRNLMQ